MTFERIYNYICELAPQLAPKNTYTIREWVAQGYSTEKDVIPAIDEACKRGTRSIYSFSFFTHAIERQHSKRLQQDKTCKDIERLGPEYYAKAFAWKRSKGLNLSLQDQRFLEGYEQQHGRVEA